MKKLCITLALMALLLPMLAFGASLQWDHPADWDEITGYIVYFNEQGDTDEPYHKAVLKADVVSDGAAVTYQGFEDKVNAQYNTPYDFWITAYNDDGESGSSNVVQYTRSGFVPPADVLPEPLLGPSGEPSNLGVQ